jgi:hypothetical protein
MLFSTSNPSYFIGWRTVYTFQMQELNKRQRIVYHDIPEIERRDLEADEDNTLADQRRILEEEFLGPGQEMRILNAKHCKTTGLERGMLLIRKKSTSNYTRIN